MRAGAFIGAACVVSALSGCEAILDFNVHPDAVPPDAPGPDAMLVPDPCSVLEPNDSATAALQLTTGENRYAAICPTTDLDVDRLLDHAAVIGPELLQLEDQVLQVHDGSLVERRGTIASWTHSVKRGSSPNPLRSLEIGSARG